MQGVVSDVAGSAHTEEPQQCAVYWQQAGPHPRQHPVIDLQATWVEFTHVVRTACRTRALVGKTAADAAVAATAAAADWECMCVAAALAAPQQHSSPASCLPAGSLRGTQSGHEHSAAGHSPAPTGLAHNSPCLAAVHASCRQAERGSYSCSCSRVRCQPAARNTSKECRLGHTTADTSNPLCLQESPDRLRHCVELARSCCTLTLAAGMQQDSQHAGRHLSLNDIVRRGLAAGEGLGRRPCPPFSWAPASQPCPTVHACRKPVLRGPPPQHSNGLQQATVVC